MMQLLRGRVCILHVSCRHCPLVGQLCMYIMYCLLIGLDMCVLYCPTMALMYDIISLQLHGVCTKQYLLLGLTCMILENALEQGRCMTLGKVPLRRLLIYVKNNASNQDLHAQFQEIAIERAADVYERQCLRLGLICILLEIAFKRAIDIQGKQCLLVGLTCMTLGNRL